MLQCHPGAGGRINCYLTLLDRGARNKCNFSPWERKRGGEKPHPISLAGVCVWGGVVGGLKGEARGGGGEGSESKAGHDGGNTEVPGERGCKKHTRFFLFSLLWKRTRWLSPGSDWCSAKLTEPLLCRCHCKISTHLEQMWLKAWNIEQTAATDPVPLLGHLCSINVQGSSGQLPFSLPSPPI